MSSSPLERSLLTAGRFKSWAASHCGAVRSHNEDAWLNRPDLGLWAVADGAGGHQSGDLASRHVVEALGSMPPGLSAPEALARLRQLVAGAHVMLRGEAGRRGGGAMIATTLVALIVRDDHFACLWAGDSRAYLLRDGVLHRATRDHSLVQEMVDSGALDAADAESHARANVITRAVGADSDEFELDKVTDRLLPGDRFLLCSDGISKTLTDDELAELMAAEEDAPAERVVLAALARQASDNITAVTVEVAPADPVGATIEIRSSSSS